MAPGLRVRRQCVLIMRALQSEPRFAVVEHQDGNSSYLRHLTGDKDPRFEEPHRMVEASPGRFVNEIFLRRR